MDVGTLPEFPNLNRLREVEPNIKVVNQDKGRRRVQIHCLLERPVCESCSVCPVRNDWLSCQTRLRTIVYESLSLNRLRSAPSGSATFVRVLEA